MLDTASDLSNPFHSYRILFRDIATMVQPYHFSARRSGEHARDRGHKPPVGVAVEISGKPPSTRRPAIPRRPLSRAT